MDSDYCVQLCDLSNGKSFVKNINRFNKNIKNDFNIYQNIKLKSHKQYVEKYIKKKSKRAIKINKKLDKKMFDREVRERKIFNLKLTNYNIQYNKNKVFYDPLNQNKNHNYKSYDVGYFKYIPKCILTYILSNVDCCSKKSFALTCKSFYLAITHKKTLLNFKFKYNPPIFNNKIYISDSKCFTKSDYVLDHVFDPEIFYLIEYCVDCPCEDEYLDKNIELLYNIWVKCDKCRKKCPQTIIDYYNLLLDRYCYFNDDSYSCDDSYEYD